MFTPTFDRVVIHVDEPESLSPGGIALPSKTQEKANKGTVVAVGPGRWGNAGQRLPVSVFVGNKVMFEPYNGTEFLTQEDKPRKMAVISETAILGILSE